MTQKTAMLMDTEFFEDRKNRSFRNNTDMKSTVIVCACVGRRLQK
jgi:hypothetical protein